MPLLLVASLEPRASRQPIPDELYIQSERPGLILPSTLTDGRQLSGSGNASLCPSASSSPPATSRVAEGRPN
jgi:hypothetical protein